MAKFLILILVIAVITIWSILFSRQKVPDNNQEAVIERVQSILPKSFKNDQFYPMTIPYLREREYDSELTNISEFSRNTSYTAYTASYNSDGFRVNGYLTIPNSEGPHPAIVFIHGYIPPTVYKTTQNYTNYVDYFARNGFVVFKPDLRGHDTSEGDAFGAYNSGDYIIDTLNAYSALQKHEAVNEKAVGLWGHSMGGNVTFRSFVAKQNIPAVVIWAGAVYTYEDMQLFGIDDNSYRPPVDNTKRDKYRQELRAAHGAFNKEDEFWQTVVPTNYLEGVSGNIQIHHAIDDTVVDIGYSRNLKSLLENNPTISIDVREYSSGGHNIIAPAYDTAMQESVQFFKNHLK